MTRRLVFRPQVEPETVEAAERYRERSSGLSADFIRAFDSCIEAIERNPYAFPRVHGDARRASLRRFPYGIIYRVTEDEIVIVACIHNRRDPRLWQRRLEESAR